MKVLKFFSIFSLLIVFLASCNTPTEEPTEESVDVVSVEVLEYEDSIICGETFNEDSVKVEVKFSDGSSNVYSGDDLGFDYSVFDPYTPGEQTIKVRIRAINKTEMLTVLVKRQSIKILMIANSFGDDTVQWVHEIGDDLGIDFTIANLYIGGCVLSTHLANLKNNAAAYEYVAYNKTTKTWSRTKNTSIADAMAKEDWDYISLQQGSYDSGRAESYNTIDSIMDGVLALKDDVEFLWNMTWAYQQDSGHANFNIYDHNQMTMYNGIINAVKTKVVPNERFKFIIPNGTAIQNARTSIIGDTLCRDIFCHLTLDLGRYIAGLTLVATVADVDVMNVNYTPNLSEVHKMIAIESVINAINNPFVITDSIHSH